LTDIVYSDDKIKQNNNSILSFFQRMTIQGFLEMIKSNSSLFSLQLEDPLILHDTENKD
jgi:hypothetical protein